MFTGMMSHSHNLFTLNKSIQLYLWDFINIAPKLFSKILKNILLQLVVILTINLGRGMYHV